MFVLYLFAGISIYLIWILTYPGFVCLYYKLKHGNKVVFRYFPMLGLFKHFLDGLHNFQDVIHFKRNVVYNNPQAEMIATNLFGTPYLLFLKPYLAKDILHNYQNYRKRDDQLFADSTCEKGLVYVIGQEWKDQRKLLSEFFTFEKLWNRIPIIKELVTETFQFSEDQRVCIIEECAKIASRVMQISFFNQKEYTTINGQHISKVMNELAQKIMMITYGSILHKIRSLLGYKGQSNMPKLLMSKEEKQILQDSENIRQYVIKLIDERYRNRNKYTDEVDVFQLMLGKNKGDSLEISLKEEIIHQYITFVFAGTDTTSHLSGMSIYMLAKHQDVQIKLRQELSDHQITFENLCGQNIGQLKYLNAFLNECLRLQLPTDGLIPRIAINDHYVGEYFVRKGTYIDVCLQPMVTDPQYFENHLTLDLNRWLNNETNEAFIPFSSGGRNCLGQHLAKLEVKIMIIYLLQNYYLTLDKETKFAMKYGFLYEPSDDRLVKFKRI